MEQKKDITDISEHGKRKKKKEWVTTDILELMDERKKHKAVSTKYKANNQYYYYD